MFFMTQCEHTVTDEHAARLTCSEPSTLRQGTIERVGGLDAIRYHYWCEKHAGLHGDPATMEPGTYTHG